MEDQKPRWTFCRFNWLRPNVALSESAKPLRRSENYLIQCIVKRYALDRRYSPRAGCKRANLFVISSRNGEYTKINVAKGSSFCRGLKAHGLKRGIRLELEIRLYSEIFRPVPILAYIFARWSIPLAHAGAVRNRSVFRRISWLRYVVLCRHARIRGDTLMRFPLVPVRQRHVTAFAIFESSGPRMTYVLQATYIAPGVKDMSARFRSFLTAWLFFWQSFHFCAVISGLSRLGITKAGQKNL